MPAESLLGVGHGLLERSWGWTRLPLPVISASPSPRPVGPRGQGRGGGRHGRACAWTGRGPKPVHPASCPSEGALVSSLGGWLQCASLDVCLRPAGLRGPGSPQTLCGGVTGQAACTLHLGLPVPCGQAPTCHPLCNCLPGAALAGNLGLEAGLLAEAVVGALARCSSGRPFSAQTPETGTPASSWAVSGCPTHHPRITCKTGNTLVPWRLPGPLTPGLPVTGSAHSGPVSPTAWPGVWNRSAPCPAPSCHGGSPCPLGIGPAHAPPPPTPEPGKGPETAQPRVLRCACLCLPAGRKVGGEDDRGGQMGVGGGGEPVAGGAGRGGTRAATLGSRDPCAWTPPPPELFLAWPSWLRPPVLPCNHGW